MRLFNKFLGISILLLASIWANAQTNPTAQTLPYSQTFSGFNGSSTTYPAGIQGWTISGSLSTSYPTAAPNGNQALAGGSAASTSAGVYDMNNKIGVLNTGSALRTIALSINTTNNTNIQVAYDAMTMRTENVRVNGLGLQYRIGTSGTFTNVSGSEYKNVLTPTSTSGTTPVNTQRISVTLPSACNNQSVVELRWVIRDSSGTGNRPSFAIDSISITGSIPSPTISTSGTLSALSTIYGNASSTSQFSVSGSNMTAGISVNPPVGFQVSTTSDFSSNVGSNNSPITVGAAGTIAATPVYLRLSASAVPNTYSGNINLTSTGADAKTVATANSTVSQKNLTISGALANNKIYDGNNTATIDLSGATLTGIVGSDNVTIDGTSATATFNNADAGDGKSVTVSGVALSGTGAGRYTLTQPTGLTANISKADQTITFNELDEKTEGDTPFSLTATASSGLTVSYSSSNSSVASISGNIVTVQGPGSTTITASQSGNINYNPATSVDRILVVNTSGKLNQTITFDALSNVTYGDASFNLTATASSSLPVSYISSNTDVATISGNEVSIVGAGSTVITATQGGDNDYNPASPANQSLTVLPAGLTIADAAAQNKVYDGNTGAVISGTLTGILNSDDVSFSGTGSFASDQVGENIEVTAAITLTGPKAGNYTLTQPSGLSADITPKSLSISSAIANDKVYDGNDVATISGTLSGVVSGDNVGFDGIGTFAGVTVNTEIAVTSTSVLTGTDAGNYTLVQPTGLTADITPKSLSVTNAAAASKNYDGTLLTTISGTLSGIVGSDEVTLVGTGNFNNKNAGLNKSVTSTSTLSGADAGNYLLTQPLGLTAGISAIELTITNAQAQNKVYNGNTNAIITGTLSGIIGTDVVTLNGTGTFADPNVATGISVTSTSTLSGTDAINYFLTQPTGLSADITKAGQTITFGTLTNRTFGEAPFSITASASSSLPVSFTSSNTSVATVSGNTVTITGVGTTIITASQEGNNNFNAAVNVQQSLTVVPGVILGWQFGNPESVGTESTYSSTTTATNLSVSSLSRGSGLTSTSLARGFAASNFTASGNKADAISNNKFFQFTITVGSGRMVSLDKLNVKLRRSGTGPNAYQWRYSLDGTNFTDIGSEASFTSTTGEGLDQTPVDLSGISNLQNVSNPQVITLRLYAWGASATGGTLAIGRTATSTTTNSLSLTGSIAPIPAPVISSSLTSSGTVGSPYSYNVTASNAPTSFNATGLPAGLSVNTTNGAISGTPEVAGSFNVTISATNLSGTTNATMALEIAKGNQTITFNTLDGKTFGDANFNLTATSTSGLAISYSSSNTDVATISGNTVTIVGAGTTDITASQAGDDNYNPATSVIRTLEVAKANQTISFDALPSKLDDSPDFELTATTSSGLPVSYSSSNTDVLTISGNIVSIVGPGSSIITASQAGNANYNPATSVDQSQLVISTALDNQTITFNPLSDVTYGDAPFLLTASTSSGLDIEYSSSNTDVATISENLLTIVGNGTTVITASQPGNSEYNPATPVQQSLTVLQKSLNITGLSVEDKVYDGTALATFDYTSSNVVGVVGSDDVSVVGNGTFSDINAGNDIEVTPSLSLEGADAGKYSLIQPTGLTGNIQKANQTIIFGALSDRQTNAANFNPGATSATSGINPITYTSTNPNVAIIIGNEIDVVGSGVTTIIASQAGSTNYNAAASVSQTLTVINAPATATWNFGINSTDSTSLPVNGANAIEGLTISRIGRGNNNGFTALLSTTSASNNSGASGNMNIGAASRNGGLDKDTSTYFEFTLTPVSGKRVTLNSISFGQRSTSSGPQAYSIRSSQDNFNSNVGTGTLSNNSVWAGISTVITPISSSYSTPITFRIYGHGGSGAIYLANNANWRLDDVSIGVILEDLPACSGIPEAGELVATNASVCLNGETSISLNNHSSLNENSGLAYKWFSSTDNENFSLINDANGESIQTGPLSSTTYYYSEITCLSSGLSSTSDTVAVTINAANNNVTNAIACGSYTWSANNQTYTSSITDTVVIGCDTSFLNLTITPINNSTTTITACSSYLWSVNNQTYTTSIADTVVNGCDTSFLNLTILPVGVNTTTVTACGSYVWNVNNLTYTSSIVDTVVNGCDSSFLILTINPLITWYLDADGDGWYVHTEESCTSPGAGWTSTLPTSGSGDCDDNNDQVWQSASLFIDNDNDGYDGGSSTVCYGLSIPNGYSLSTLGGDCNDGDSNVNPGATEICGNGIDDNCNEQVDEGCPTCTAPPALPGLIPGPAINICAGTTQTYTITPVIGATSYLWTTTGDITIDQGQGTTSATFIFGPGFSTGSVRVQAVNDCGTSPIRAKTIKSTSLAAPGIISGPALEVCKETEQTYSIAPVSGATAYRWSVSSGDISVVGSPSDTSATFAFGSNFTTGTIRVQAINDCGSSSFRTLTIASLPSLPGVISGTTSGICPGNTGTYSISTIPGLSYVWSTTGDITILNGQGTGNIEVSFGSAFTSIGTVRVQSQNACGISALRSISIRSGIPPTPGLISGTATGVCANDNQTYSIASVAGASSYVWSTVGNINITDGQGTNSVTVNFGTPFISGSISVQSQNVCGLSAARTFRITGVSSTAPRSITGETVGICANTTGVSYTAATVAGATSYVWSATGDITIAGGQGTQTASFDFGPTFSTGTIRVQAVNACGALSVIRLLSVRAIPSTPSVISGNLSSIVPGTSETYSVSALAGATSYEWVLPANASISSGSGTNSITVDFAPAFTGGILRVRGLNACGATGFRSATLSIAPAIGGNSPTSRSTAVPLSIYPNPAKDKVMIQGEGIQSIMMYDVSGKLLYSTFYQSEYQVEIGLKYPLGVYFLQITGDEWSETRKLVIE